VAIELHQLVAALYLVAGLAQILGIAIPKLRFGRAAPWLLGAGAFVHGLAFAQLHTMPSPPSLTHLPTAVSLMAWIGVLQSLALLRRARLEGLAAGMALLAFVGVFYASLALRGVEPAPTSATSWPHLHVILASAGLSLLAVAGLAGALFIAVDRALKSKRPAAWRRRLPSLEALDRVNSLALSFGFPLLSCGVVAGMLWTQGETGRLFAGGAHAIWSSVAWAIYLALVVARFRLGRRGREAAVRAALGFAFLLFVVVGVGALT
jgi:ABC-type uncharacterized transport system permease subunit